MISNYSGKRKKEKTLTSLGTAKSHVINTGKNKWTWS
jgi:hypothetical protein